MTGEKWKSFWMGTIAAVVIAVAAGVVMTSINLTAGEKFSSSSTRLLNGRDVQYTLARRGLVTARTQICQRIRLGSISP